MRLVAGVLALTLFAPFVRAEGTTAPAQAKPSEGPSEPSEEMTHGKVPLRVVRVMPESRQALLFDRVRGTHVLAEIGGKLDGYVVENIDDDEVTLRFEGKQIVLAAPARGSNRRRDRDLTQGGAVHVRSAADARPTDTASSDPTPVDPYGEAPIRVVQAPGAAVAAAAARAIEPGEGGIRVVQAPSSENLPSSGSAEPARPIAAGDDGVRVVQAPGSPAAHSDVSTTPVASMSTPVTSTPVTDRSAAPIRVVQAPQASGGAGAPDKRTFDARAMAEMLTSGGRTPDVRAPAVAPEPRTAAPASSSGAPDTVVLSRGEVDDALGDFSRLTAAIRGSFSASGVTVDAVGDGTIFQRAGLRAGDVITAIDGARLRSLDDAANLYARASTARAISAQIVRAGKPMTLHIAIQ